MSSYSNDPRVVVNPDGRAHIPEGNWRVWRGNVGGSHGWIVVGDNGQGHLKEGDGSTKVFATVDDGIYAVIGDPQ